MDGEVTADVMNVARKLELGMEPVAVAELLQSRKETVDKEWLLLRLSVLVKIQRMLEK